VCVGSNQQKLQTTKRRGLRLFNRFAFVQKGSRNGAKEDSPFPHSKDFDDELALQASSAATARFLKGSSKSTRFVLPMFRPKELSRKTNKRRDRKRRRRGRERGGTRIER
jgi:hypothetical protein